MVATSIAWFVYQNAHNHSFDCTTIFINVATIIIWKGQYMVVTTIAFLSVYNSNPIFKKHKVENTKNHVFGHFGKFLANESNDFAKNLNQC